VPLDRESLRMTANEALQNTAVQREQGERNAAAAFPALLGQFLTALEQYVQSLAQAGCNSAVVLSIGMGAIHGDRMRVPVPKYVAMTPNLTAAFSVADALLGQIAALNGGYPGLKTAEGWAWPLHDPLVVKQGELFSRTSAHFDNLGLSTRLTSNYHGGSLDNLEVSWNSPFAIPHGGVAAPG
jgi:hypothetical protein